MEGGQSSRGKKMTTYKAYPAEHRSNSSVRLTLQRAGAIAISESKAI